MNYWIGLTIIGVLTGLVTGVIGAGPEVLIVPLLAIFNLLDSTKKRIGTSLFMLLPPIGLFAALKFYNKGYVDVKAALYMAFIFVLIIGEGYSELHCHIVSFFLFSPDFIKIFTAFLISAMFDMPVDKIVFLFFFPT